MANVFSFSASQAVKEGQVVAIYPHRDQFARVTSISLAKPGFNHGGRLDELEEEIGASLRKPSEYRGTAEMIECTEQLTRQAQVFGIVDVRREG